MLLAGRHRGRRRRHARLGARSGCAWRCAPGGGVPRITAPLRRDAAGVRRRPRRAAGAVRARRWDEASIPRRSICAISRCTHGRRPRLATLAGILLGSRRACCGSARSPASWRSRAGGCAAAGRRAHVAAAALVAAADRRGRRCSARRGAGWCRCRRYSSARRRARRPRSSRRGWSRGTGARPSRRGSSRSTWPSCCRRCSSIRRCTSSPSARCAAHRDPLCPRGDAASAGAAGSGCRRRSRRSTRCPGWPMLVARRCSHAGAESPRTETAFRIWSQTVLARQRLTSDLEIYDEKGALVSRFALNFPEYLGDTQTPERLRSCEWEMLGEALLFGGAQERNTLHAQRSVCVDGTADRHAGRSRRLRLPHAAVHQLSVRLLRRVQRLGRVQSARRPAGRRRRVHGLRLGADRDLLLRAGRVAARRRHLPARVSIADARAVLDVSCTRAIEPYEVYLANDRQFIYALGYAIPGVFDHFVRLAELTTLAAAAYVLVLVGNALFARLARVRAAHRTIAAARDPRQLLPQAVPRLRAGVDLPGPDPGGRDPDLLRRSAPLRHRG